MENIIKENIPFNIGKNNLLHLEGSEKVNFIWVNSTYKYTLGNEDSTMGYSSGFNSIETSITEGFWLAGLPVSIVQWELLKMPSKPWFNGKFIFGVSWLESLSFLNKLNILYQNLLPQGYIFSLPTELQWEFCSKQESCYLGLEKFTSSMDNPEFYYECTNLQKSYSKLIKEGNRFHNLFSCGGEWCFNIAAYYSKVIENWNGYLEDYWIGEENLDSFWNKEDNNRELIKLRIVRGVSDIYYQRFMLDNDQDRFVINGKEFYHHIGFRICVRRKTKWDYPPRSAESSED